MRKVLRGLAVLLVVFAGVVGGLAILASFITSSRLNQTYDVKAEVIQIPSDSAALARGEYLANAICTDCHGANLSGGEMINEPGMATVYAPNITPSENGVGHFTDADYVRAIRHAVDPQGRGYMIMPAEVFINWSEEDLGATIAYLKSLPPDDNSNPPRSLGALGRMLFVAGMFGDIIPAAYIDHEQPFTAMPQIGETADYGAYVSNLFYCTGCHGPDMRGGPLPKNNPELGTVPSALKAASWSDEEFITALTTGVKPDGGRLDKDLMPWESISRLNQKDLTAIHRHLQQLAGN